MQSNAWLTPQKNSNKIRGIRNACVEKVNYAHDKLCPGPENFSGETGDGRREARNQLDTKVDVSSVN